ncbi:hypothetical protein [Desulfopila sp. IMCC35008]|uniref:hypothetical protein n=1 Tax=Desulfopila sp. IMCC35008 TaxID=2653858 RepID=UPI0013CFB4CD|nr:hypothetical protein [Desulfopila sp. IMCC35008]
MDIRVFSTRLALIVLCIIGYIILAGRTTNETGPDLSKPTTDFFFDFYKSVQKTEPSELADNLVTIVEKRLDCYDHQYAVGDRIKECQKEYLLSLVTTARTNINSAPLLGKAIPAFKLCPVIYAMCKGETEGATNTDCINMEVRAIEYFLDQYWRGAAVLLEHDSLNL